MITDPIADFLTRIRNAANAKHRIVEVPASCVKPEEGNHKDSLRERLYP